MTGLGIVSCLAHHEKLAVEFGIIGTSKKNMTSVCCWLLAIHPSYSCANGQMSWELYWAPHPSPNGLQPIKHRARWWIDRMAGEFCIFAILTNGTSAKSGESHAELLCHSNCWCRMRSTGVSTATAIYNLKMVWSSERSRQAFSDPDAHAWPSPCHIICHWHESEQWVAGGGKKKHKWLASGETT